MSESSVTARDPVSGGGRLVFALGAVVILACVFAYGISLNGPLLFDDGPNLLNNTPLQLTLLQPIIGALQR